MFEASELDATATAFLAAVRRSDDAGHPEVSARAATLDDALVAWKADGARLPASEPVLRAASNLQVALYGLNPEGLPFSVRDASTEMLTLVDEAEANGFDATSGDEPLPEDPAPGP